MSFQFVYQQAIADAGYHKDAAQTTVVERLECLYQELLNQQRQERAGRSLSSLFTFGKDRRLLYGCYLWGGVGRGKTWLMDLFLNSLPVDKKSRFHFHEFMQQIHGKLAGLNGQRDPLKLVAREIAKDARLVCLDEFHVSDITDAMLLYGLLEALYQQGVVIVMTSNVMPDELYKNGLQRGRFLPAIGLIKQHSHVIHVDGSADYRTVKDNENLNYYCPLSPHTDTVLEQRFYSLTAGSVTTDQSVVVQQRPISTRMVAQNGVWFDFESICAGPRAASDYLYLAGRFEYVVVSNVYKMAEVDDDVARRFINLVDAFYDRGTGLIVSATAWPGDLYTGRRFKQEFKRTVSRLEEIRSRRIVPPGISLQSFHQKTDSSR